MSLVLPNSSFAQEEKRAEREAAQRAKAEAAAKQQASPEASPQASPEAAGAVKDEKKEGEDDNKPKDPMSSPTFTGLKFRSIGPAFTSGRVIGFAVDPNNSARYFVASASGGVWKTINNGATWTPVFDKEGSYSIGAIALDPKNPLTVWVGTGENNSQRSVSYGNGVYRSDDGGKSWKNMGLKSSEHIGRIAIDPKDSNIVYVAAQGPLWGPGGDRGLYKTTDNGKTWKKILSISDNTGVTEIVIDQQNPETLYAAAYQRRRHMWTLINGGPESAIYKSTDAGATWNKLKAGLPTTDLGRVGMAISPVDSNVIYAIVEAADKKGGIFRSNDRGGSWERRNEFDVTAMYYARIVADPKNVDRIYVMNVFLMVSDDGGKTLRRLGEKSKHVDNHDIWIDPNDTDHYLVGCDGGVYESHDRGANWDFKRNLPITQFYDVTSDNATPFYNVYAGAQDNFNVGGPSRTRSGSGITNSDWFVTLGGDGFRTQVDPEDPNIVYSESQGGNASRLNIAQNTRAIIMRGGGRDRTSIFEDSVIIARGDTARAETPEITRALAQIRTRAAADSARGYRFNWSTPFFLSSHSATTVYLGGNRLLKSTDRGDHFFPISPDLSTRDSARIIMSTRTTGGITRDNSGAETHGTISTVAESPIRPGILWVGTDDGNVWLTTNDGGQWTDITTRFPGVPKKTWISRVEPSHFDTATVYVTFDNHRENDFRPYVYASNDFGKTFRSISNNLPTGGADFVHVIREDPANRDLLFLGSDVGAYVSTDRGASWQRFMTGLPTVPVHDLQIHPRDRELIAATHGRSIWIVDVAPLEQMNNGLMARGTTFFTPKTAYQYSQANTQNFTGNKYFLAPNPTYGAELVYRVTTGAPRDTSRIIVTNIRGDTVRTFNGSPGVGLHRAYWDLRGRPRPLGPAGLRDSIVAARVRRQRDDSLRAARGSDTARVALTGTDTSAARGRRGGGSAPGEINLRPAEAPIGGAVGGGGEGGPGGGGFFGGGRVGNLVDPGDYMVTIIAGGQTMRQVVHVERVGEILNVDFGPEQDEDSGGDPNDP